ncbi:MAG: alpha/beta hydrolase, partial [Patescibacteria group bacterium]
VFIVHGWDGYPEEGWFPWLKKKLEEKEFKVFVPQLPQANEPRINKWVPALVKAVGIADGQTYFVGHSMGCQTIARYLESLPDGAKIGGVIFVAGFFKRLTNLEDEDIVRDVAREWLTTPLDLEKVKSHLTKSVAIFSDDDPYVSLDNQDDFKNKLNSKIIIKHNMKHFSGSTGTVDLSAVLNALLKIAK